MRIVSRGKTAKDWSGNRVCGGCRSKLEVSFADLTKSDGDQRELTAYYWRCPVCARTNWETQREVEGRGL